MSLSNNQGLQILDLLNRQLSEQRQQTKKLHDLFNALGGSLTPDVARTGFGRPKQFSLDKSSTFTDTIVRAQGFNVFQISSDGALRDVSYKIRGIDGTVSEEIEAAENPQFVGYLDQIIITNDTAESGTTVRALLFQVPWMLVGAILHGTSQSSGGLLTEARLTPRAKGRIFNTAVANNSTDFFGSDLEVTNPTTLFRFFISMSVATTLTARITSDSTTVTALTNSGENLVANAGFGPHDILLRSGDTLNFRHGSGSSVTINYMLVDEIAGGTQ